VLDFASRSISGDCQRLGKKLKKLQETRWFLTSSYLIKECHFSPEVAMIHPS
jgi:hypothetical protein